MANKLYEEASIQKIANTIRTGNQSDETYKVSEMPFAISEIDTTAYGKIPSYWNNAVENAIATIEGMRISNANNIPLFAWFSDMHKYPGTTSTQNAGNTGILSATVMNRCGMPFAMFCGDAMASGGNGFTSESQVIDNFIDVNQMLSPIGWHRLLQTQGNHDGSWGTVDGVTYAYQSTQEKLNKWIYRKMTVTGNHVFGGDGSYYYVDDTENKIRIIMLNSLWSGSTVDYPNTKEYSRQHYWGYGQTQLDWLCSTALNVGDDWVIIIGTHIPPTSSYKSNTREYNIIRGILTAYEDRTSYSGSYTKNTSRGEGDWANVSVSVNFSTAKGKIIGFFAGHCHKDQIITDDLPFPIVTITADANIPYDNTEEKRVFGTDNEHAIDFVTVNRVEESVTLTRLGVGSSRAYSYGGATIYTISNNLTNVTTNNGAASVEGGTAYAATLTVNEGYENLTVIVTMGGIDVTQSCYFGGTSNGMIEIAEVTGDVVINAVATMPEPEFVNKMVVQESNINKRISGTAPSASGGSGAFVCDPIAVNLTQSCPVIMKNFASTMGALNSSGTNYINAKVALLNASKTYLAVWYIGRNDVQNSYWKCVADGADMVGDLQTIFNNNPTAGTKPNPADVAYVVFSPQISTSAITASDLTGLEIQLME